MRIVKANWNWWTKAGILPFVLLPTFVCLQSLPVGAYLVPPLEARFQKASVPLNDPIDGIIALGGGDDRIVEAARLAIRHPEAKVIVTGDDPAKIKRLILAGGIAMQRLVVEPYATNTFENAIFTGRLLHPHAGQRWLLVTSPAHMPRAVGSFRKAGFAVLPWPVTTDARHSRLTASIAGHEWLGLIAYRLLGRTDAFFPGPEDEPTATAQVSTRADL